MDQNIWKDLEGSGRIHMHPWSQEMFKIPFFSRVIGDMSFFPTDGLWVVTTPEILK